MGHAGKSKTIASRSPSSIRQISATAPAPESVSTNFDRAARAARRGPNRVVSCDLRGGRSPCLRWRQWLHCRDVLCTDVEHDPACHEHARPCRREDGADLRGGGQNVLEIVEYEQHAAVAERSGEMFQGRAVAAVPHTERRVIAGITKPASAIGARSTQTTPPAKCSSSAAMTTNAKVRLADAGPDRSASRAALPGLAAAQRPPRSRAHVRSAGQGSVAARHVEHARRP